MDLADTVSLIMQNDEMQALLSLPDEVAGVTPEATRLLVNDARLGIERDYVMRSPNKVVTAHGPFLHVWSQYDASDYGALYVTLPEEDKLMLVHRKPDPRMGFTPFAKENLLHTNNHVRDTKRRTYVMGGKDSNGKRIRHEMRATILVAWLTYAAVPEYTHIWVKWKDGTRKLVHRKGL